MVIDAREASLKRRATPLEGIIYRSTSPKYACSRDLLSGEGSRRFGGRWNPVGIAAVYGSFSPQTAMEETLAHFKYYELPIHAAMPRTFVAIEFKFKRVADLTDGRTRQAVGVSAKRLLDCDWRAEIENGVLPLTQVLGRAAFDAGLEALLVHSAADPSGRNLVVFVDNVLRDSVFSVSQPQDLEA